MKKYLDVYLFAICVGVPFVIAILMLTRATINYNERKELQQVKEDVRQLTNDIDEYGDIDTYTGSDHFERLYNWAHNIK